MQLSMFKDKKEIINNDNKKTKSEFDINSILRIKESFELPNVLMEILFDEDKKNKFFDKILTYNVDLSKDFMRDYFQEQHSNRKELKQDYTPDNICSLIQQIIPVSEKILDICTGTGSLILNNYKTNVTYYCEELSSRSIPILLFNLSIRGLNAVVKQVDVLKNEIYHTYEVRNNGEYSIIKEIKVDEFPKFDVIVSNPPYSLSWDAQNDKRFTEYPLPPKSKADYAFILDALFKLTDKGKAFLILPHGVLFRGNAEAEIRESLIKNNLIETIIGLPDKLFLNTQIPVCIMVLNKNKVDKNILFINAQKEFIKNKKQNILSDDNINKIKNAYIERKNIENFSKLVTFDELEHNDFNLNIPRYVSLFDPEPVPDLKQTISDIIDINKDISETNKKLKEMIEELQGTTEEDNKYYQENIKPFLEILEEL